MDGPSPEVPPARSPAPAPLRWLALAGAWLATGLGLAGAVLPLLPTTPFLIVAAALFSVGSPRMHAWLLAHPRLGPYLNDWTREHAIPRRAKILAMALLWTSILLSAFLFVPLWPVRIGLFVVGALVSAYLLTRPEPRRRQAANADAAEGA